ncbi:MAG: hypothetical protein ACRCZF_24330 [Gemmataceae bacterium]
MTRMLVALALSVLAVECAKADWGTAPMPMPPGYGAPPAPSSSANRYGAHPMFKKLMWWKKDDACAGGHCGHCAGGNCGVVAPPPGARWCSRITNSIAALGTSSCGSGKFSRWKSMILAAGPACLMQVGSVFC